MTYNKPSSRYAGLREEAVKNKVAQDYFSAFEHTDIIGNIDFCIAAKPKGATKGLLGSSEVNSILWAEAKSGVVKDIKEPLVQLILTIGRARTFNSHIPPRFLGAFDSEKIAFVPYHVVAEVFTQNDFNWNVAAADRYTKEFTQLKKMIGDELDSNSRVFNFTDDDRELRGFIKASFSRPTDETAKIHVDKNNFTYVYQRWSAAVKPSIGVDWELLRKAGLMAADFFLADLLSENNRTIKDKLFILLNSDHYELDRRIDESGLIVSKQAHFMDGQKAHKQFWNVYERPPHHEYWNFIVSRRDLLVPQDVRERKGSFFTPEIWVKKSQEYLAAALGENWQDDYYIWDCCAGTGNLLDNLTNYHNVWASTIDKADVDIMKDRSKNGWNMFENHVFQMDFLNDDFSEKCPDELLKILNDPDKRRRLVVYINPPYAEAGSGKTIVGTGENKSFIATQNKTYETYKDVFGKASNEIYAQFLMRIYKEIPDCVLAQFSKLKIIQAPNFAKFRSVFKARLEKSFIVPAWTFDNVNGKFPIGFFIWDLSRHEEFNETTADVYDADGVFVQTKALTTVSYNMTINHWVSAYVESHDLDSYGFLMYDSSDFQAYSKIAITNKSYGGHHHYSSFYASNLCSFCVYFAVRLCIAPTWLNDRDQFLYPKDTWQTDEEFKANCLIYALFSGQNRISSEQGVNHWIPFTEAQVGQRNAFKSRFMSDFLSGKIERAKSPGGLFEEPSAEAKKVTLSPEAQDVYNAGLELWRYYHAKHGANPDASFCDIRKYFQGVDEKGRMKNDSIDERYTELIAALRGRMRKLAAAIEPKVYEHGFLR